MAAAGASAGPAPGLCPSFAVLCSFMERYGAVLELPDMTFPQMEKYLQDTSAVSQPLVELHVKLLRKLGKSVTHDKWEKYLIKMCQEVNNTWAWELETKGYSEISMEFKTDILKYLCECQFDDNLKFKMLVNEEDPEQMRLQPIGKDEEGLLYWFQMDQDQNVRLYVEEQDDLDGSSWKCIVRTRNDLADTLEKLKSRIEPVTDEQQLEDCHAENPELKPSGGALHDGELDEVKPAGTKSCVYHEEEKPEIVKMDVNSDRAAKHLSVIEKVKEENVKAEQNQEPKPSLYQSGLIDNRVSTIKSLVKDETTDSPRHWNAVSVVVAPVSIKQEVQTKPEACERSMKSDQQAKIPLKKRELKRSEDFSHNNSNGGSSVVIVCNPAALKHVEEKKTGPGTETLQQTSSSKTVDKARGCGVIISPIEHGTPTTDRNGLHAELDSTLKTAVNKDFRQSVLVTKPSSPQVTAQAEKTFHVECMKGEENRYSQSALPSSSSEDPEQRCSDNVTRTQGSSEETSGKRKAADLLEEQNPEQVRSLEASEERQKKRLKRKKRSEKIKAHIREDEEVSSELQEEGIRLKIKIPLHRRTPSLRRSARICRPSLKLAAIQERKQTGQEEEKNQRDVTKKTSAEESVRSTKGKRRHRRHRWTKPIKNKVDAAVDGNEEPDSGSEKNESESELMITAPPEDACKHCGLPNHPELILLCDLCDNGYHTACLRPPLMIIPDGEWFCPPCQHKLLCEKLEEQLQNLDAALKKRERAERRRERLVYVGISVENIIPNPHVEAEEEKQEKKKGVKKSTNLERRSTRKRKCISYRFDDFDEAIEEAIEEDIHNSKAEVPSDEVSYTSERREKRGVGDKQQPIAPPASRKKRPRRRLNDLDSESTADEEESEDDFQLSDSMEEEEFVVTGDDGGSEAEAGSWDGSDQGSIASSSGRLNSGRRAGRNGRAPRSRRSTRKSTKAHRGFSEEEEEEEEEEEALVTGGSSEGSDAEVNVSRRRSRRNQKSHVNYCETSESEESQQNSKTPSHSQLRRHSNSNKSVLRKESKQDSELRSRRRQKNKHIYKNLKRGKSSSEEKDLDEEEGTGTSEEEEPPLRKRPNRIETDEDEEDEEEDRRKSDRVTDSKHQSDRVPSRGSKGSTLKHNGQLPMRPSAQDEDEEEDEEDEEEDLSATTDFVNFVFDSEQLS